MRPMTTLAHTLGVLSSKYNILIQLHQQISDEIPSNNLLN